MPSNQLDKSWPQDGPGKKSPQSEKTGDTFGEKIVGGLKKFADDLENHKVITPRDEVMSIVSTVYHMGGRLMVTKEGVLISPSKMYGDHPELVDRIADRGYWIIAHKDIVKAHDEHFYG